MPLYHDRGVVLRTHKLGEADRIVSFLTRDHGKVRAVAKGVRKTKSRFGGRLEPPGHVELLLYEGRGELDIVSQAETIDHFRPLRETSAGWPAVSMLEAADQLALERQPNRRLYGCWWGRCCTLSDQDAPLVVPGSSSRRWRWRASGPRSTSAWHAGARPAGVMGAGGGRVALRGPPPGPGADPGRGGGAAGHARRAVGPRSTSDGPRWCPRWTTWWCRRWRRIWSGGSGRSTPCIGPDGSRGATPWPSRPSPATGGGSAPEDVGVGAASH